MISGARVSSPDSRTSSVSSERESICSPPVDSRQTTVRQTRRSDDGQTTRLSATRTGSSETSASARKSSCLTSSSNNNKSSRPRRATPTAQEYESPAPREGERGRKSAVTDDNTGSNREINIRSLRRREGPDGRGYSGSRIRITRYGNRFYQSVNGLNWYERLMPEFLLNMTAPITGYESRLDSDVDEDDYDILERQRLKRNRKIRRRLLTVLLIAGVAGLFMYTKGKMFRKIGVKAAVTSMKDRVEHGLARSIQETMGK